MCAMRRWGLAQMSPNGEPPLTANCTIQLRARATEEEIDFCWEELQKVHGDLPSELRAYAAGCPALLCHYVQEHLASVNEPIAKLVIGVDHKFVAEVGWPYFCSKPQKHWARHHNHVYRVMDYTVTDFGLLLSREMNAGCWYALDFSDLPASHSVWRVQ